MSTPSAIAPRDGQASTVATAAAALLPLTDPLSRLPVREGRPTVRMAAVVAARAEFRRLATLAGRTRRVRLELTHIPSTDAALIALVPDSFDVVLLDRRLQGAGELVRQLGGGGRRSPFPLLMLADHDDEETALLALGADVADVIERDGLTAGQVERAAIHAWVRHQMEGELARSRQLLRQARDEARRANAAKSDFLARMSHELRTPLNAINGYAEMMAEEIVGPLGDARYREYARNILASGHHLLDLINDLLDLSRIESGRYQLALEPFDVAAELTTLVETFFAQARRVPIALRAEVEDALPPLMADRRAFRQVAINLLSNALKFTGPHGAVTVRARRLGSRVEVSVADTGIGVDPSQIERLFTPFVQADTPFVRSTNGTGLGLAIVKSLVETHGGVVQMESEPGRGTTVATDWPIAPPPGAGPLRPAITGPGDRPAA